MSLYHKTQTGETLPTVSANKDRIIPELSRHPRPTSEKKKRKEKNTLSFKRKGNVCHACCSVCHYAGMAFQESIWCWS